MILSGLEIKRELGDGILITPFSESQLGPNSYNLRLFNELLVYQDSTLDMSKPNMTNRIIIPDTGLRLDPLKLYLGRTAEYTKTEKYIPMLEGRSSIGRLGMFIHVSAGFGDIGFAGYWTLEIFCIHPTIIYPNIEICQIYFHTIQGDSVKYSSNKYQNNNDIQPSLLHYELNK